MRQAPSHMQSRSPLAKAAVLLAGTALLILWWLLPRDANSQPLPRNHLRVRSGQEWQLIVIGNSHCVPSSSESLRAAVRQIANSLALQATAARDGFTTLGVATDDIQADGIGWLRNIGEFDEISVGRQWLNQFVLKYMPTSPGSVTGTPTILLVSRKVTVTSAGGYLVEDEKIAARLTGLESIVSYGKWVSGAVSATQDFHSGLSGEGRQGSSLSIQGDVQ